MLQNKVHLIQKSKKTMYTKLKQYVSFTAMLKQCIIIMLKAKYHTCNKCGFGFLKYLSLGLQNIYCGMPLTMVIGDLHDGII